MNEPCDATRRAWFRCSGCGDVSTGPFTQRCEMCGGIVRVEHAAGMAERVARWGTEPSMWRYAHSLELAAPGLPPRVSFGEGWTPLIETDRLFNESIVRRPRLKLELINPTGSFKDRAMSVSITHALRFGARGIVGSSSGNALHAQAAYAAMGGLPSVVLVPEKVPLSRLVQPIRCGTKVIRIRGDYSECHRLAREIARRSGWYNVSTTYENPMGLEGLKTIAYELWEVCRDSVGWIVIPVGAGPLLAAVSAGFAELIDARRCCAMPQLLGVQAANCAPIVRAFEEGANAVTAWDQESASIAKGIADPLRGYPDDGTMTLAAVRASGGAMVSVDESEIEEATRRLAARCGLHVDPAAGAALAGLGRALKERVIEEESSVVVMITGTGFKETPVAFSEAGFESVFDPSVDTIEGILPKEETHDRTFG